jgi:hypothetical protein
MTIERALGTFTVRAASEEASAFRCETGGSGQELPFTFPVRWLARPDFHASAADMIGDRNWVPIHESQSFDYRAPLAAEVDYMMTVKMQRQSEPSRIILLAEVGSAGAAPALFMEMILRIVPLPNEAAA